uniref:YqaJ viral recombinase domain-containing protein n=1 Tax=viral metagenome TaxID=1070528 RepID=A0A6C0BEX2_9ZZZZ
MYKAQLQKLLNIPKVQQKTEKWYEMRMNMITASDFAQALGEGKFGTQKQLIEKKCTPRENENAISKANPFFKWGNMFEPVAVSIYEKLSNAHVHEFGLIQHPKYSFFGASPDGITDDGIMLEIKCPFKRKLTGDIPLQYYYQIQGQLDVCGLEECDYFECMFELVDSRESFMHIKDKIKGVIKEIGNVYEYQQPFMVNEDDSHAWCTHECKYWVLQDMNLKRVVKDAKFVDEKLKELEKIWDKILYYRSNPSAFQIEVLNQINIDSEKYSGNIKHKSKQLPKKKFNLMNGGDTYMFLD